MTSYNTGKPTDLGKALDSVYDYNKTLITVATGTVALSATFLKDLYVGEALGLVIAAWITLGLSVFAGMVGMGAYVSQYAESDLKPRRALPEYASLVQLLAVVVGLCLLGGFAIKNAEQDSKVPSRTPQNTHSSQVTGGVSRSSLGA
jgi:hypothetical protein